MEEPLGHLQQSVAERTRELATLNAIAQTVSESVDLETMLPRALDKVLEVLEFESGAIYLKDLETGALQMACSRGLSAAFRSAVARGLISARVAESCTSVIIDDLSREPDAPKPVVEDGYRSVASIPLLSKEKVHGVLTAASRERRFFGRHDSNLLLSIGQQIGLAVESARLFDVQRRQAEQFRLISEVGRDIISILDVDRLLREIALRVKDILGYYLVGIGLIEDDSVVMRTGAGPYWEIYGQQPLRLKVGGTSIVGLVADTGRALLVPDVSEDPHYYEVPEIDETRSELAVPLRTKNQVIGVLDVQSKRLDAFDENDVVVLESLANQAAMAIDNARLYEQAQQLAALQERERLGRELHDAVTQTLFSASLIAEVLPRLWERDEDEGRRRLAELGQLTRGALAEMRTLLLELRPGALAEGSLADLLRQLAEATTGRVLIPVQLMVEGECSLPPDVQVALYRIAQEALNNVARHSGGSQALLELRCQGERVELIVADRGYGFDVERLSSEGMGLRIMRERAEDIGAAFSIHSQPSKGTQISVVWPDPQRKGPQ
jgi:signal transduction histidine kinase